MKTINLGRALLAGLVATAAMTMLMLAAPFMGMPAMNIGAMLGGAMGVPEAIGWAAHFMIGAALAIVYARVYARSYHGRAWLGGALFALIPWLVKETALSAMMGAGAFESAMPAAFGLVLGAMAGHLVYGAVLGAIYGAGQSPQAVHA